MDPFLLNRMLPQAQRLYDIGSREAILDFLQKNDPEGIYTDKVSFEEGYDILTYDEALLELEGAINELVSEQLFDAAEPSSADLIV